MLHALLNANLGTSSVLKSTNGEWKRGVLLVDDREECAGVLALEVVLLIKLALVNRTPGISSATHTISRGRVHIQMNHITRGEFPVIHSLLRRFFIYDNFVSIIQMLLGLVREHALEWLNLEISAYSLDVRSHLLVCVLWFYSSGSSLESSPGSHEDISLLPLGLSSNNKTVGARGREAIDVSSKLNLNQIFHFQSVRIFFKWREVAADLIDRDAAGEGNTSLEFL